MNYASKSITSTPEILKNDHYVAVPLVLDFTSVPGGVVKAGTPINASGIADNTATAIGILLHDTYVENPNGTIVKHGFINKANAQANSALTFDAAMIGALKMISFE